jgi:hypothetical protein
MDTKQVIMLVIVGTVAAVILMTFTSWMIRGPESISPDGRERMYALIALLVGILSGYLLGKRNGGP